MSSRADYTSIVSEYTPPRPGDVVTWGVYSRYWQSKPVRREVLKQYACEVSGVWDSPTAHARDYLKSNYKSRLCKSAQREILVRRKMPLYAQPTLVRSGCYVDVRSAWWSIMNLTGWDCDYWPDRWFARGAPPDDFPLPDNKIARSALVSLSRSSGSPVWRNGIVRFEHRYNPHDNPHIYAVVADVLHALASVAISAYGARYVASDGYIVPEAAAEGLCAEIESWGLSARIKARGPGAIYGPGSYWIGDTHTVRTGGCGYINSVDQLLDVPWIYKRIVR